jgi:hypothetical protein
MGNKTRMTMVELQHNESTQKMTNDSLTPADTNQRVNLTE